MPHPREVLQSPVEQGASERLSYKFDFTNIGAPTSPSVYLLVNNTMTDASSGTLSGTATTSGNNVITPVVLNLTAGTTYRLECKTSIGTRTYTRYCLIKATADRSTST